MASDTEDTEELFEDASSEAAAQPVEARAAEQARPPERTAPQQDRNDSDRGSAMTGAEGVRADAAEAAIFRKINMPSQLVPPLGHHQLR